MVIQLLNVSKTKFMVFGVAQFNSKIHLNLNGVEIKQLQETKFLGW